MLAQISPSSLEFSNIQAILNTAANQPIQITSLERYPTFRPPKLVFIVDFYEFCKSFDLQDFITKRMRNEPIVNRSLYSKEMSYVPSAEQSKVLIYTGLPTSYENSFNDGIELDANNVFPLYEAEVKVLSCNIPIQAGFKSDIESTYNNVAKISEFHAQKLIKDMQQLNEMSVRVENDIFNSYKKQLDQLQNRTQFAMNLLQSSYIGFEREKMRADAILHELDEFDTVQSMQSATETVKISRFVADFKFSQKMNTTQVQLGDENLSASGQEKDLIQFFNEKRADYNFSFSFKDQSHLEYNFTQSVEREFNQYNKQQLKQDIENWLLDQGRLSCDYQKLQLTAGMQQYLQIGNNPSAISPREYQAIKENELQTIKEVAKSELVHELTSELQEFTHNNVTNTAGNQPPSPMRQAENALELSAGNTPTEQFEQSEPSENVTKVKELHRNELTTQTTKSLQPQQLLETKFEKFGVPAKAKAVQKVFNNFKMPEIEEFDLLDYENEFILICYHYAKYSQYKRLQNLLFMKRKNYNSRNLLVILQGDEIAIVLIAGGEGYEPKGVIYRKQTFEELGDCKVSVGGVEAVGMSLKGKILNIDGEVIAYEKGVCYDIDIDE